MTYILAHKDEWVTAFLDFLEKNTTIKLCGLTVSAICISYSPAI